MTTQPRPDTAICPQCGAEMLSTVAERWTGKYENVLNIYTFWDCPQCGYATESIESEPGSEQPQSTGGE